MSWLERGVATPVGFLAAMPEQGVHRRPEY
jgi:hypothetical protein